METDRQRYKMIEITRTDRCRDKKTEKQLGKELK